MRPLEELALEFDRGNERDPAVVLDLINEYYDSINRSKITNLDDVTTKHATLGLSSFLGFNGGNPSQMKTKLVEYGIFSEDLNEYDASEQERIIENVIDNISTSRFSSYYLNSKNPKLDSNREIIAKSPQMREYLQGQDISNLDDIASKHATFSLGSILGFNEGQPFLMKEKLVEYGIFSEDLNEYSAEVQSSIIKNIFDKMSNTRFSSSYLSSGNPTLDSNREIIASSPQMREYLQGQSITNLDDVVSEHAIRGISSILGLKQHSPSRMKEKLVEYGIFSEDLNEYSAEEQERIIENIFDNIPTRRLTSYYLNSKNPKLDSNRRIVASSPQMMEHLESKGITNLDDVVSEHAIKSLGSILGFNEGDPFLMKEKLVEYGIFSEDLNEYSAEVQSSIIKNIFDKMSNSRFSSYYLSLSPEYPNLDSNRRIIASSPQMMEHLESKGITNLDDVVSEHATSGLGNILGFNQGNSSQMREKLVKYGTFSEDLSDSSYESLREKVSQTLIDNVSKSNWNSFYTSVESPEILQLNREIILASEAVQNFFEEQGYEISNPDSMNNKVRLFFSRYFGTNDIDTIVPTRKKAALPLYRRILKEWDDGEKAYLQELYTESVDREMDFVEMLRTRSEELQEAFGVSLSAVINQCQRLDLISVNGIGGAREASSPTYVFPKIHEQEFPGELKGFGNYASLLSRRIIPAATPVFAFESAVHEQFSHATLPVRYNGADPSAYNEAEQAILSAVQHYISDNGRFLRNEKGDVVIDPTTEHGFDPRILQIRETPSNLTQLIFRSRFNPGNEIGTTALDIGNGKEIYVFMHENVTYQNTRAA